MVIWDSLSADNNPMVLVELNNLSHRYGTSIYAVDWVNGSMYGKFSVGYRMIPERLRLYLNTNTLLWRMIMCPPMRIPYQELPVCLLLLPSPLL